MSKHADVKKLIVVVLAIKLVVILVIAVAHYTVPFCDFCYENNFLIDGYVDSSFQTSYQTWDVQHYIFIAQNGYTADHISNAFYPLYPALIALTDVLVPGPTIIAAWLLSSLISILAVVLVFRFVERWKDTKTAWKTILLVLAFPTAFYLHLPYAEGIFLLLVVGLLYGIYFQNNKYTWLSSILLPLTRPQGLVMLPVILTHFWRTRVDAKTIPIRMIIYAIISTTIGVLVYCLIMFFETGSAFAGFEAQTQFFASKNSVTNFLHPVEWFRMNFITVEWAFNRVNSNYINRVFFISFLAMLVLIWRRLDLTLFVCASMLGLLPALAGDLVSFPRYMLVILPMFMALALTIQRRGVFIACIVYGAIVQLCMLALHSQNYFVA